nr:hypothetical protein [Nocardia suismassiliense]
MPHVRDVDDHADQIAQIPTHLTEHCSESLEDDGSLVAGIAYGQRIPGLIRGNLTADVD